MIQAKPHCCPVCGQPAAGRVLVCAACWARVPRFDQIGFRRQYLHNLKNPAAWSAKGESIVRKLKEKNNERL